MRSETSEQIDTFCWASRTQYQCEPIGHYMFAIPNEGKRTKRMGARLKAQGLRSGIPDFMLAIPVDEWHGLFVEMKVGDNDLSDNQVKWRKRLLSRGYKVVVAYSCQEAKEEIKKYLRIED